MTATDPATSTTAPSGRASAAPTAREPLLHRLAGAAAGTFAFVFRVLPAPLAYGLMRLLWIPAHLLVLRGEKRAAAKGRGVVRNLRIAFRDRAGDPAFVRRILRGYSWNLCRVALELCRLPRFTAQNLHQHVVDDEGWRGLAAVFGEGRGVIGVTGHIGSPEITGHFASVGLRPMHAVMRPLPIAPVNRLVERLRTCGGQQVLTKWGAIREARRVLRRGGIPAFLVDENENRRRSPQVFEPFLGTLAATPTSAALLHLRTGAPITVATSHPVGRDRWRFHLWRVIRHAPSGDHAADVAAICREINLGLSAAIRAHPEEWFWGMRRFWSRPEGEVLGDDGLPPDVPGAAQAEQALADAVREGRTGETRILFGSDSAGLAATLRALTVSVPPRPNAIPAPIRASSAAATAPETSLADARDAGVPWPHRAVGHAAAAGAWLLCWLPAPVAYALVRLVHVPVHWAVLGAERRSARRGRGIVRNLRIAFREQADDPAFVRRMLRGYSWQLCRMVFELTRLPRLTPERLRRRHLVHDRGWDEVAQVFTADGALIAATGHMGSPEVAGHVTSVLTRPAHSVMRPAPMVPLNRLIERLRSSGGQRLLSKWGAIREVRKLLLQGELTALLVDENEAREKTRTFAPFLGTQAATPTSVALLHLRTGAPIAVVTAHPVGIDRWRFLLWKEIRHEPTGDKEADVLAICREINLGLSAAIRAFPEQWFWGMRRYATRPADEPTGADGLPPPAAGAREAEEALAAAVLVRSGT